MAITEEDRHRLYQRLEEVLGREQAATMMEHLPPVGWADVATKRDLDHLAAVTTLQIDGLRVELRGEIGGLRGEIGGLRGEIDGLRGEIDGLRGELRGEIERLGDRLRAEWRHELQQQVYVLVGANVAVAAAVVAAIRL